MLNRHCSLNFHLSLPAALLLAVVCTPAIAAAADSDQPADAPAAVETPAQAAEGGGESSMPAVAPTVEESPRGVHKQKTIGVGARFRVVSVPKWLLNLFLDHSTGMTSVGVGGEFILHRRTDFDVVFGLEYENISPANGLYQEKGDDPNVPGQYPDFTEFDSFAFLSVDASFVWHTKLSKIVDLRYGAGIGLGLVLGDIYSTDTDCGRGPKAGHVTLSDLDSASTCPIIPGATREKKDVPPVVPVVNLLVGTRIKATDNIVINVELGFRNMFFAGLGVEYIF
jgi:hypothetical protein